MSLVVVEVDELELLTLVLLVLRVVVLDEPKVVAMSAVVLVPNVCGCVVSCCDRVVPDELERSSSGFETSGMVVSILRISVVVIPL